MKKIARKIAMIMVLLILANSFISCFTITAMNNQAYGWLILTIPLDLVTLPLQLIGAAMGIDVFNGLTSVKTDSQIYLANAESSSFTEISSLFEKIYSDLPETELNSIKQKINAIPETENDSTMKKILSIDEEKIISLISAYNSLPEREIISSVKRINSLPDAEFVSLLQTFNSLSEEGLNSLISSLKSMVEKENVAMAENLSPFYNSEYVANVGYSREKVYSRLCFYY